MAELADNSLTDHNTVIIIQHFTESSVKKLLDISIRLNFVNIPTMVYNIIRSNFNNYCYEVDKKCFIHVNVKLLTLKTLFYDTAYFN